MLRLRSLFAASVASSLIGALALFGPATHPALAAPSTLHYSANDDGAFSAMAGLGYNLADTGPSGADALPAGMRAVAWVGEKCPAGATSAFTSLINAHSSDAKIYAWYLSDEPHVASCASGPAAIAAEADYIHAHSAQRAFIVLLNSGSDYAAFNQSATHVDAIGIDPYPCSSAHPDCPVSHIDDHVNAAEAAGISPSVIVPTIQAFADSYYTMPSPSQLQAMLDEWARLVPNPAFDYTYSWGCQSSLSNCLSHDSADQSVMAAHNAPSGSGATTTTAAPPSSTTTPSTTVPSPTSSPPQTTTTLAPSSTTTQPSPTTTSSPPVPPTTQPVAPTMTLAPVGPPVTAPPVTAPAVSPPPASCPAWYGPPWHQHLRHYRVGSWGWFWARVWR